MGEANVILAAMFGNAANIASAADKVNKRSNRLCNIGQPTSHQIFVASKTMVVNCSLCLLIVFLILFHDIGQGKFVVVRRRKKARKNSAQPAAESNQFTGIASSRDKPSNASDSKAIICAVLKNEELYVDEWIKYNKYLGFDFIQLYDNSDGGSAKIAYLPQKYGDFVRVQHLPGASIQLKAYNLCAKKYATEKFWAAFIDVDEFIVLRKHPSIKILLSELMPRVSALSINRIFFGSNGHLHYDEMPVLKRYTARTKGVDNYVKTITYLPDALRIDNHYSLIKPGKRRVDCHNRNLLENTGSTNNKGTEDIAAIYHYYTKSFDEFRAKRLRGDVYKHERGVRYHKQDGEVVILSEFLRFDKDANAVHDTRALEFYQQREAETPDFPPKPEI